MPRRATLSLLLLQVLGLGLGLGSLSSSLLSCRHAYAYAFTHPSTMTRTSTRRFLRTSFVPSTVTSPPSPPPFTPPPTRSSSSSSSSSSLSMTQGGTVPGIRLVGIGSATPKTIVTNLDLEQVVETSDEWIQSRTGIAQRHLLTTHDTDGLTGLGVLAAQRALDMSGIAATELDVVICATSSPDDLFGDATTIAAQLGCTTHTMAFDLVAACSGFLFGMVTASQFLQPRVRSSASSAASSGTGSTGSTGTRSTSGTGTSTTASTTASGTGTSTTASGTGTSTTASTTDSTTASTTASTSATRTTKTILVVGADALSRWVDWQDRNVCILFGDAAGAVVMQQRSGSDDGNENETSSGLLGYAAHSNGEGLRQLNCGYAGTPRTVSTPGDGTTVTSGAYKSLAMNGREVYKFATREVPLVLEEALDAAHMSVDDIDWLLLHQANIRIMETVADRLGIPMSKVITNLSDYGNTSAASIPLALDEAVRAGKVKKGHVIACAGFGAGLSWGSAIIRWG